MRGTARTIVVLAVLLSLAAPSASALYQAVDHARVRPLWSADYTTRNGTTATGVTGEGVNIVGREGYDGTHPDLDQCASWEQHRVIGTAETGIVTAPRNDQGGHGNHVAGIVCGSGEMSDGEVRGVAWESTFITTGIGCSGPCETNGYMTEFPFSVFTSSLASDPIDSAEDWGLPENASVLFFQSVGNEGGDGSSAQTEDFLHSDSRLIGIAASTGRDMVAPYSSRGDREDSSTWPSLTAPGCMFSIVPPPWVADHVLSAQVAIIEQAPSVDNPNCPNTTAAQVAELHARGYARKAGTSMATPFAAGVVALMYEVNPDLPTLDAKYIITHTADPFLSTNDTNGNDRIEPVEFYQQHGYKAGWGLVNATAAVAAANYADLHPNASMQEAVTCSTVGDSSDGGLVLNPGGGTCPAWFSPGSKNRTSPQNGSEGTSVSSPGSTGSIPNATNGSEPPSGGTGAGGEDATREAPAPSPLLFSALAASLASVIASLQRRRR